MLRTGAATGVTGGLTGTVVGVPPPDKLSAMLTEEPLLAVIFPVTVISGKFCPAPTDALYVQVKVDMVQVQFDPLIAVGVNPASGSTTITGVAALVAALPLLATWIVYVAFCSLALKFPCVATVAERAGVPDWLPPLPPPPPQLTTPRRAKTADVSREVLKN
jgi:hypothetical protein